MEACRSVCKKDLCYITAVAKQGGYCICHFFGLFFLKNRFLSDYVVVGCPKYIFGNFRNFLKNSEKFFKKFLPWALLIGPLKLSPMSKNHFCRGLRRPKIAHDPKNRFFQVRDIDTPIQPRKKKHQTNVSSALKTF